MATLHVLRVFSDEAGGNGNPLGIFLNGAEVPAQRRQAVAADLGFSETVYVDDRPSGKCRIFTPGSELGFAGHPSVGTAWLLAREGEAIEVLRPPAGEVEVGCKGGLTVIAAQPEWSPPWQLMQMADAAAVEALRGPPAGLDEVYCWAWEDEPCGRVRSRCFAIEDGVGEDEATGSAAIVLAAQLARELEIHQGRGSRLYARPLGDGRAEVGGRVVLDEVREYPLPIAGRESA
jgi:predicted PhzF superfamily epimerase YddE/YHI9